MKVQDKQSAGQSAGVPPSIWSTGSLGCFGVGRSSEHMVCIRQIGVAKDWWGSLIAENELSISVLGIIGLLFSSRDFYLYLTACSLKLDCGHYSEVVCSCTSQCWTQLVRAGNTLHNLDSVHLVRLFIYIHHKILLNMQNVRSLF